MMKKFLKFFLNLVFLAMVLTGCGKEFSAEIGEVAPEITASNSNGEKVKINSYEGVTKIIVFWQYGCLGCTQILPNLDKFLEENPGKFEVFAINSTNDEKIIKNYLDDMSFLKVQILKDDLKISLDRYGVTTLPSIFIVGKDGIIKDKIYGDIPWKSLKAKLSYYL